MNRRLNPVVTTSAHFEDIEFEIKKILRNAKESIRICVAWINGMAFGPTLLKAAERGVLVEVIFNDDVTNSKFGLTASSSYKLFPIRSRISTALMHNKFCIVDNEVVITGSYNWSRKACHSFENIIVVRNDFQLVKSFRHEFNDLLHYYEGVSHNKMTRCHCSSYTFNLAILGQETGIYQESETDIWKICSKSHHAIRISRSYAQFLQTQVGLKDGLDYDDGPDSTYDKDRMLSELKEETRTIKSLQNYFNVQPGIRIHAIGSIVMINELENIEYQCDPEYAITIGWRDMYFRKIIPEILYDHHEDVSRIISTYV